MARGKETMGVPRENKQLDAFYNHEFDFDHQYKDTYDDWIKAFEKAVAKLAVPGCFIGMGSGYDSGAIVCALLKLGIDFKVYIVKGKENMGVVHDRMKLIPNYQYFDKKDFKGEKEWVKKNVEDYKYTWGQHLVDDSATWVLSKLCKIALSEGRTIQLSGQGGDEITSDYALRPALSTFKGVFPEKLFCWDNFYDGGQQSYLMKEENVAKVHGIDTRYPYLDIDVVQEFLWLSTKLKNAHYKAPIREYLVRNNFPYVEGVKQGLTIR